MLRGLAELIAVVVSSISFAAVAPLSYPRELGDGERGVNERRPAAEKPAACFQVEGDLLILAIPGASEGTTLTIAHAWPALRDVVDHHEKIHVLKIGVWADDSDGERSGGTCSPVRMHWHEPSESVILDGWTCENFGTTPFAVARIYCLPPEVHGS